MVCVDGNFGLVRKASSGKDVNPPRMGPLYFADQADVDKFVASYDNKTKSDVSSLFARFAFLYISSVNHKIFFEKKVSYL
jgi:hypothetical protein